MLNLVQFALLLSGLLLCCVVAPLAAQSCTSCGPECVPACGSRRYRTCCFNYLRRRRSPAAPGAPLGAPGPGLVQDADDVRLQLVLLPSERLEPDAQDTASSLGLLHRLLDAPETVMSDTSVESTSSTPPSALPLGPPPAPAPQPPAGGAMHKHPAPDRDRDWLRDLRRRVGLLYNV